MEAMFSKMMEGCMKGMSEEDKKRMMACCGEMIATMSSCTGIKDMSEENKEKIREKMMACCGSKMEMMSGCFKKTNSTSDQACCAGKV